jgi:hypothetical protein
MSTPSENNNAAQKNTNSKANKAASYDIAKSDETLDLAKDLAKFIKENKLSTQVQGKEFVNVEGWQYAGSRLGIVPVVEHLLNVSTDQEIKYQAKVTLFDLRHSTTVGAGFAICSNKESGRKFYQEFAIASMAQTRAVGKAYRNILAWIIRAAGYEPTPAEEMEYTGNVPAPAVGNAPAAQPQPAMRAVSNSDAQAPSIGSGPSEGESYEVPPREDVLALLARCISTVELKALWKGPAKAWQTDTVVYDAFAAKGEAIKKAISDAAATPVPPLPTKVPAITALADRPAADEQGEPIQYATAAQKEEIMRLLAHHLITPAYKAQVLQTINRLTESSAASKITQVKATIESLEGGTNQTAA